MPLLDLTKTTRVDIGNDWYILKDQLGFYEETIVLVDQIDVAELQSFRLVADGENDENGAAKIKTKRTPGEILAHQNLMKLKQHILKWSHSDDLNVDNIKRISRDDARILMKKITELEGSVDPPFRPKKSPNDETLHTGVDPE